MRIAVLALQGAFIEHEQMLDRLGVSSVEIRQKRDLERPYDGLIIPGGESTVQGKLMCELGLFEPIKADCKRTACIRNLRRPAFAGKENRKR